MTRKVVFLALANGETVEYDEGSIILGESNWVPLELRHFTLLARDCGWQANRWRTKPQSVSDGVTTKSLSIQEAICLQKQGISLDWWNANTQIWSLVTRQLDPDMDNFQYFRRTPVVKPVPFERIEIGAVVTHPKGVQYMIVGRNPEQQEYTVGRPIGIKIVTTQWLAENRYTYRNPGGCRVHNCWLPELPE